MEKEAKPTWDYFELLIFILGWMGLFLFLIAVIFAHHLGFITALKVSLGYWLFIIIIFISIIFLNLVYILLRRTLRYFKKKSESVIN
jgi:hypothetical protein